MGRRYIVDRFVVRRGPVPETSPEKSAAWLCHGSIAVKNIPAGGYSINTVYKLSYSKLNYMKYLTFVFVCAVLFSACSNNEKITTPAAPGSVADVSKTIKGKNYKTVKLGILSPLAMDSANAVSWAIEKEDTSKFFRDYANKQLAFALTFSNDSTCSF